MGKKPKIAFTRRNGNYVSWYDDGKINIFQNCIEANLSSGLKNKIAIYNINKEKKITSFTFQELSNMIHNFSDYLSKKLKKNIGSTTVIIHGSASLETAVVMMSCAKLGIHFSVILKI